MRHAVGELGIDKGPEHRDHSARNPGGQDKHRRMDPLGHDIGIDEDPRADNAAHDQHRRVKGAELPASCGFSELPCCGYAHAAVLSRSGASIKNNVVRMPHRKWSFRREDTAWTEYPSCSLL